MSTIRTTTLRQSHTGTISDAKVKLSAFTSMLTSKFHSTTTWTSDDVAAITGTKLSGTITVGATEVTIVAHLETETERAPIGIINALESELKTALA